MILNSLLLENYKQYRRLELSFREGLVGIVGKNGAGKSTIFEAILYCLFGRDESNKALVRSSFADPKATVTLALDFSVGEVLYAVKREFRGKTLTTNAEFYKNDVLVAKGMAPVNEEIAKVLHMERDAFKRSVFSGQKELSELSDTTGEARKRMVRKMLGLDTLDDVQKSVNNDKNVLENQAAGQRQSLLSAEDIKRLETDITERSGIVDVQAKKLKTEEAELKKLESTYRLEKEKFGEEEQRLTRYNALNRELGQLQERISGLTLQRETLNAKQSELLKKKAGLDEKRAEYEAYISEKKALAQMEEKRQRKLNYDTYSQKIAEHKEQIAASHSRSEALRYSVDKLPAVESMLQEKQQSVAALESEIETKRNELREKDARIADLQARIRERSEKIASLRAIGKDGTCPTCFQPLLDSYEKVLAELGREVEILQLNELKALEIEKDVVVETGISLKKSQNSLRQEVENLLKEQSRLGELAKQIVSEEAGLKILEGKLVRDQLIIREIGEVHFDESVFLKLREKLEKQDSAFLAFAQDENYIRRELPATQQALKSTEASIAQVTEDVRRQNEALAQVSYDAARYEAAKQVLTSFDEALSAQSAMVRQLEKTRLEMENEIAQRREKLLANERIQSQISDKLAEIELLNRLSAMLGQFKTDILERVSPSISKEASDLFSRITRGKYESIRVDENFDFSIADGGVFYPIERFSGGEIDLANFCLRIAVTKAIMELSGAGQGVEFLAFDEIFGSQDEERRHEMMLALNYLQEQFRQIYIVSHIESLKDYFPHILEVQYGADGSSVVWR